MTTQHPIRTAIIGAGIFAREQHVPALLADGRYAITAVCSRSEQSARTLAEMLPTPADITQDIDAVLSRADIDAVDLVLPIPLLPNVTIRALEAGKHVIGEKPIAPTVADGQRMLDAYARHSGPIWMVAENYRFEEPFIKAAEVIASGEIGRVMMADWAIYVPVTPDNKYYQTDWRQQVAYPGGFLLDGGVHHIAGLRYVLGEVAQISAVVTQRRDDLPPADTLSASLLFDSGAVGSYSVTYAAGAPWYGALQVVGERGALRISRADALEVTVDGQTRTIPVRSFEGVKEEMAAFADTVLDGAPLRNTPQQALQDLAVLEAMLTAGATGQAVTPVRVV